MYKRMLLCVSSVIARFLPNLCRIKSAIFLPKMALYSPNSCPILAFERIAVMIVLNDSLKLAGRTFRQPMKQSERF